MNISVIHSMYVNSLQYTPFYSKVADILQNVYPYLEPWEFFKKGGLKECRHQKREPDVEGVRSTGY